MAKRIRDELPAEPPSDAYGDQETYPSPIFTLMLGYETVTPLMLPMFTVLNDAPTAIETYVTVAVINPASKRKDQALRFLEYCAAQRDPSVYFYNAAYVEPTQNQTVVDQIPSLTAKINRIKNATEPLTPDQRNELAQLESNLADLQNNRYLVTTDAIRHYANLAQNLSVSEASPITYDEALQGLAEQYLKGILGLQAFVDHCQAHVRLIRQENTTQP